MDINTFDKIIKALELTVVVLKSRSLGDLFYDQKKAGILEDYEDLLSQLRQNDIPKGVAVSILDTVFLKIEESVKVS